MSIEKIFFFKANPLYFFANSSIDHKGAERLFTQKVITRALKGNSHTVGTSIDANEISGGKEGQSI